MPRHCPLQVLVASGKLEDARKVLESAMNLPGVRTVLTAQQRARLGRRVTDPTTHERATIYLLLAEVLSRLSKIPDAPEAKKVGGRVVWCAWRLCACCGRGVVVCVCVCLHSVHSHKEKGQELCGYIVKLLSG